MVRKAMSGPPLCVRCWKRPAQQRKNCEKIPVTAWPYVTQYHHLCGHCFTER